MLLKDFFPTISYSYQKSNRKKKHKTTDCHNMSQWFSENYWPIWRFQSNYIAFHVQKKVRPDKAFPPWQLGMVICLVSASSWPRAVASCMVEVMTRWHQGWPGVNEVSTFSILDFVRFSCSKGNNKNRNIWWHARWVCFKNRGPKDIFLVKYFLLNMS